MNDVDDRLQRDQRDPERRAQPRIEARDDNDPERHQGHQVAGLGDDDEDKDEESRQQPQCRETAIEPGRHTKTPLPALRRRRFLLRVRAAPAVVAGAIFGHDGRPYYLSRFMAGSFQNPYADLL